MHHARPGVRESNPRGRVACKATLTTAPPRRREMARIMNLKGCEITAQCGMDCEMDCEMDVKQIVLWNGM